MDPQDAGEDDRTYCYCDEGSYGEMIACDNDECEREWFHFGCLDMTTAPHGKWYCDECKPKSRGANKKAGRGGRRKATAAS